MHPTDDLLDDSEQIPPPSLDLNAVEEVEDEDEIELMDISMSMNLGSRSSSPRREYSVTHSPKSKSRLDIDNEKK
jgi:hypothetical protein